MSASTVSITAANPGARRRPVIAADKNTTPNNLELLANDITLSPAAATSGAGGGKTPSAAGNNRDLSHHSIRGEAVLERSSKDPTTAAKKVAGGNSSVVAPRRSRKPLSKSEKPRWLTVASIFAKNFVLLVVLVGLFQLIRRTALKSGDGVAIASGGFSELSELEGRISDVEELVKKTTKMIQVQVDVIDKKVENEGKVLRKEIDVKGVSFGTELRKLEEKLSELKTNDWLTKQEFEKFVEELKDLRKGNDYDSGDLDEIREFAKGVIVKEIEKHAADGLGRVDYALASGGAMVVKHSEPFDVRKGNWFLLSARNGVHPNADKMLKPSFGEPGQCFPLKGSSGFVQIRLRTDIIPESVTLEHVAKSVAYDRSSAPKDCRVSGWWQAVNSDAVIDSEKMFLLAEFTYDLEKSNAQTFNVLNSAGSGVINTVRLDFTSNHGSPSHTCIYRLRVHGREPDSVSMIAMQ